MGSFFLGVVRFPVKGQITHYERAPCLRQSASATDACGGFAPTPPGFGALVPLPIWSFTGQIAKGGRRSIPPDRSRPLSRRSGCFPALPCPPLSPHSFYSGGVKDADLCGWL